MKKTASLITIHIGRNFGSNLQALATVKVLKSIGIDSVIVNYIPPRVTVKRYFVDMFKNPKKILGRIFLFPSFYLNEIIHRRYLAKYCSVSKPIYSNDIFSEVCPKSDFYITGSDQVWNSKYNEGIDTHYFFEGIVGKKIAFSSSIGASELNIEEKKTFSFFLKDYYAVSVRESTAKALLNSIGIQSEHLLDPTLMLDTKQWLDYMSPRIITEPYIFVYAPYNIVDKSMIYESAKLIAKKKGLKIVTYTWTYFSDRYADRTVKYPSPGDFLSLMYYADCIITNSFHGTAFSINFNKQFWVYMPNSFSSRIYNLLSLCNVENRLLDCILSISQEGNSINYDSVNKILNEERNKVIDFLNRSVK